MNKGKHSTVRSLINNFQQIVNIGPKISEQFFEIGLKKPSDLIDKDPLDLYKKIIQKRNTFIDPCVLDCYISAIDYMNGNSPTVWWKYTKKRKEDYSSDVDNLRDY